MLTFIIQIAPAVLLFLVVAVSALPAIGQGRMLVLGASAFYVAGAFTSAAFGSGDGQPGTFSLLVGALAGSASGALLAVFAIRLRGDYFALASLAFGELLRLTLLISPPFPGPQGIARIPRGTLAGLPLDSVAAMSVAAGLLLLACAVMTVLLVASPWGAAIQAAHDHEIGARSAGLPVHRIRFGALVYAGAWGGAAGALGARYLGLADVESFSLPESIMVLVVVLLAGSPSVSRCLVVGSLIGGLSELLRFVATGAVRQIGFGAMLFALAFVLRDDLRAAEAPGGLP